MKRFFILTTLIVSLLCQSVWAESKTNVKKGMAIGALSGAGTGLLVSLPLVLAWDCHNGADESCPSSSTKTYIVVGSTLGTAAIGTGIGALIGSLIPKKQNVSVLPIVTHDDKMGTMGGLFLSKGF